MSTLAWVVVGLQVFGLILVAVFLTLHRPSRNLTADAVLGWLWPANVGFTYVGTLIAILASHGSAYNDLSVGVAMFRVAALVIVDASMLFMLTLLVRARRAGNRDTRFAGVDSTA